MTVTNNFGNQESDQYVVDGGQNFFSLLAVDPQLMHSIHIRQHCATGEDEQIRFGGLRDNVGGPSPTVPEPATLALFGAALLFGGRRLASRVKRPGTSKPSYSSPSPQPPPRSGSWDRGGPSSIASVPGPSTEATRW